MSMIWSNVFKALRGVPFILKSPYFKVLILLVIAAWIFNLGANQSKYECIKEREKERVYAEEQYTKRLEEIKTTLISRDLKIKKDRDRILELQTLIANTNHREIIHEIPNIKTGCGDLGVEFSGMFKHIVNTRPDIPTGSPEPP